MRYGARLLRLNPVFTLVATLSLALGIGANTAIFQLLDALRLRTLPVKNPQELAEVKIADRSWGSGNFSSRHPESFSRAVASTALVNTRTLDFVGEDNRGDSCLAIASDGPETGIPQVRSGPANATFRTETVTSPELISHHRTER